jgi:polyhydroxyalkanoate synthesis regulator phasin
MLNSFEKSINLGLGLLVYSREKIEELVEELVNKGEVAKKDARQFAGELVQRGEEQREELKKMIQSEVAKALDNVHVAKKEDIVTKDEIREIVREQIQQALTEQGFSNNGNIK